MTHCTLQGPDTRAEFKTPMLNPGTSQTEKRDAVVIKKYANRRLYNTQTSTYVTLEDLAEMVRSDKDFVVYDAKSGDELTHAVLTQIIVEQESRKDGQPLLPVPFLRQLIRFYDDQIGRMVPSYLQFSLENLVKEQETLRQHFTKAFSNPTTASAAAFEVYQDMARQNMAMFEQAMSMWGSFGAAARSGGKSEDKPSSSEARDTMDVPENTEQKTKPAPSSNDGNDLNDLRQQLEAMQARIDRLTSSDKD